MNDMSNLSNAVVSQSLAGRRLENKSVILTGAAGSIGRYISRHLLREGAKVTMTGRDPSKLDAFVEELSEEGFDAENITTIVGDCADPQVCRDIVSRAVDTFGKLDVLVNNAGTTTFVPHDQLEALTEEIWLRTLRVNLIGAFMMSREAAPHIGAAGGGEIIMTSSIASMTANGSSIAYCASKAGMNSLTRTLAKTLGQQKIRVNAVLPGLIDGDWAFNTWGGGDAEQYDGLKKMFADQTPLGHVVTPDDVADAIMSLITGSDYVTGQLVTLDSGFTL